MNSTFLERIRDVLNSWYTVIPSIDTKMPDPTREVKTFTIAANAQESDVVDCGKKQPTAFLMPSAFDGSKISLLGSTDGVTFFPIKTPPGNLYTLSYSTDSWIYVDEPLVLLPFNYVKVKSDVAEANQRTIDAILRHVS